jgi:uncharacterized protein YjbI with pentapeptide repeats
MSDTEQPPLPGDPPELAPLPEWTDLECWAWREIGAGRAADINQRLGRTADPNDPADWSADRRLSAAFLQTIALHEPFKQALPRHGIEIIGAWFDQPLDLRDGRVKGVLWLHQCRFEQKVGFNGLRSESVISLQGSVFEDDIDMRSLEVEGGLYMRNGARFKGVNLYGARIGRNINTSRASFAGRLILNAIRISGNFIGVESCYQADVGFKGASVEGMMDLRRSRFSGRLDMWWLKSGQDLLLGGMAGEETSEIRSSYFLLDCRNARIGGQLNLNNVDIAEDLNLSSITIVNEALLGRGSHFANINLRLAKIGQHLSFATASIAGRINLTAAEVGRDVSLWRANAPDRVDLVFARIGGSLDLCGGSFGHFDLTGTVMSNELRLSNDRGQVRWAPDSELILRNARADAIHDTPDAWPDCLELDGFVYNRFGGLDAKADHDLRNRRSSWFETWLAKDVPHTPQPYRQCAKVLIEMGHPEIADDVLYAGRERDRNEMVQNKERVPALGLWFLKATIGYGHGTARYFRAFNWVAGLTLMGVLVLILTGDYALLDGNVKWEEATGWQGVVNIVQAASFSLNKLLPIIDLPIHHAQLYLGTISKLYFQFHKLMGYILALFLIAGITGLTK